MEGGGGKELKFGLNMVLTDYGVIRELGKISLIGLKNGQQNFQFLFENPETRPRPPRENPRSASRLNNNSLYTKLLNKPVYY